ncbi:hypothetical protein FF38_10646 [Lucilia cuprina]|uniref:Uncharacterized protein n=1 Tax=Lucilia cuprina TaxID=7375 RepID=A0A0L0CS66_LUCCU|nr:hypothetical protein FF38_10646 [Lucilia cuprina]
MVTSFERFLRLARFYWDGGGCCISLEAIFAEFHFCILKFQNTTTVSPGFFQFLSRNSMIKTIQDLVQMPTGGSFSFGDGPKCRTDKWTKDTAASHEVRRRPGTAYLSQLTYISIGRSAIRHPLTPTVA